MDPRHLRHSAWKLVGGVTSRSVGGKKVKKVTNIVYFTYLPRSPRCSDRHQICSGGWFPGRNQLCQILFQSVQGFWFCRGSNFSLSHRNEVSPLTQGLNYRSACDNSITIIITKISSNACGNIKIIICSYFMCRNKPRRRRGFLWRQRRRSCWRYVDKWICRFKAWSHVQHDHNGLWVRHGLLTSLQFAC